MCWDASLKEVSDTRFEAFKTNFTPKTNLEILFCTPLPKLNSNTWNNSPSIRPNTPVAKSLCPARKAFQTAYYCSAALSEKGAVTRATFLTRTTRVMLAALNTLGVSVTQVAEHDYDIIGTGGDFPNKSADLFMGNAGTAIRPLTAVLALQNGVYHLHGVPRMHERDRLAICWMRYSKSAYKCNTPATLAIRRSRSRPRTCLMVI